MNTFIEYFLQFDNIKTSQKYENRNDIIGSSSLNDYCVIRGWLNGE